MTTYSAPGKLFLLGEYGVLAGGRGLVAAVDRRALATATIGPSGASPLVSALLARTEAKGGVAIDTGPFRADGRKLGVGSSSAAAVAGAAALLGRATLDVLGAAIAAHRDSQGGRGSGLDVAAAYFGGVLAGPRQPGPVERLATALPGLELAVFAAPRSAVTAALIDQASAAPGFSAWTGALAGIAEVGISAWAAARPEAFLAAVRRHAEAFLGFGVDHRLDLVDPAVADLIARAERLGGAAKPSGAGGGDVAIAWVPVGAALPEVPGLERVQVAVDPIGLRAHM